MPCILFFFILFISHYYLFYCLLSHRWHKTRRIPFRRKLKSNVEDAITTSENDDETDWTVVTDYLNDLRKKPLNLNTATKEELAMIPGFSHLLANNLHNYLQTFGSLMTIYELQAVPGFTHEVFDQIKPYVQVKEREALDISPNTLHPKGPSIQAVFDDYCLDLVHRVISILQEQKG